MSCKCGYRYRSVYDAVVHNGNCGGEVNQEIQSEEPKKSNDRSLCNKCGNRYGGNSVFERMEHKCPEKQVEEIIEEDIKPKGMKTKEDLKIAMNDLKKTVKGEKKACPFCNKAFVNLNKHLDSCKKR